MNERQREISKFLSLVLRHHPGKIGIKLDHAGWVDIDIFLAACSQHDFPLTKPTLLDVVRINPKKRFAISEDGLQIRAQQGHSTDVDLGYQPVKPPQFLYHGTARQNLPPIRATGLKKFARHHVHFSPDDSTARRVSRRHGMPVVLVIKAEKMYEDGHKFFHTPNDVWLTEQVPVQYIKFPSQLPRVKGL